MLSLSISYYLSELVSLVYPAWASVRAVQSVNPEDDTQWLTYWICHAALGTLSVLGHGLLEWIPFYYEAKVVLLIWLMSPKTQGALLVYEKVLQPFLRKYASRIDPVFSRVDTAMNSDQLAGVAKLAETYGPKVAAQAMELAVAQAKEIAKRSGSETERVAQIERVTRDIKMH